MLHYLIQSVWWLDAAAGTSCHVRMWTKEVHHRHKHTVASHTLSYHTCANGGSYEQINLARVVSKSHSKHTDTNPKLAFEVRIIYSKWIGSKRLKTLRDLNNTGCIILELHNSEVVGAVNTKVGRLRLILIMPYYLLGDGVVREVARRCMKGSPSGLLCKAIETKDHLRVLSITARLNSFEVYHFEANESWNE